MKTVGFDQIKRLRVAPDSKLWSLPGHGVGVLKLLMVGLSNQAFDPVDYEEWHDWVASPNRWGALFTRTQVRQLPQDQRAWSEVGLEASVRRRPSRDNPLEDIGPLARAVGIEWKAGLEAMLAVLAREPDALAMPLVARAIAHAVECDADTSLHQLVSFAQDKGWAGKDIGLSGKVVAGAWMCLVGEEGPEPEDDMVLDGLLAISALRPDAPSEVAFWKELHANAGDRPAQHAMEAWVKRYPASWDRLHDQALVSAEVPCAWMMACEHAFHEGVRTPLFQVALDSDGAEEWMQRLGWGEDPDGSPLAAWWARWVDILHTANARSDDERPLPLPGLDPVSKALREAGAPEPGSREERALGGKCFAALLPAQQLVMEWFDDNPHWVYEHPRGGSNPMFHCTRYGEFEKWRQVGFSPRAVNGRGETAAACFIANAQRNHRRLGVQLCEAFAAGTMPSTGMHDNLPLVHHMARLGDNPLLAWMEARLEDPLPHLPSETRALARRASGYVVQAWHAACRAKGYWDETHDKALWSNMAYRDTQEDKDAWDHLLASVALPEDEEHPLWLETIDLDETPQAVASAMAFLQTHGAASPDASHPAWESEQLQEFMGEAIKQLSTATLAPLLPKDAPLAWWKTQIQAFLAPGTHRSADNMECWLQAGLPLEGEVLQVLHGLDKSDNKQRSPWWEAPRVVSALQGLDLDASVPSPTLSRPRRF